MVHHRGGGNVHITEDRGCTCHRSEWNIRVTGVKGMHILCCSPFCIGLSYSV